MNKVFCEYDRTCFNRCRYYKERCNHVMHNHEIAQIRGVLNGCNVFEISW